MTRRALLAGPAALAAAVPVRMPRPLRAAILGTYGHHGEMLTAIKRLPDVSLVAVADPDPVALKGFVSGLAVGNVRTYASSEALLDTEKPDVAAIGGPNALRAADIHRCVARGTPFLSEKPFVTERAALYALQEALRKRPVAHSMMLPMRFEPVYLALAEIARSGEIGEVLQMDAQKSYIADPRPEWMRHRATYGGTIPWIGIHMVDLMRYTSGREFSEVCTFQSQIDSDALGEMEAVTASVFRLRGRGTATLRMDYLRPGTAATHGDDRLRLAGTLGVAEYQASTGVTVLSARSAPATVTALPPARSLFVEFLEQAFTGKPAPVPEADIWRIHEIVLAARESAEWGGVQRC